MADTQTDKPDPKGAQAKSDKGPDAESMRAKYGVTVVLAGLGVVLAAFAIAAIAYSNASGVSTALAPVTGVVGTIVGAYFGVQVGASGKKDAEDARSKAEDQAKRLAAVAPSGPGAEALGFELQGQPSPGPQGNPS